MPAVPEFQSTEQYAFTPLQPTNPGADSAAAGALASGGAQVASAADDLSARLQEHFSDVAAKAQQNQDLTDATALDSRYAVKQAQLQQRYANDADPRTLPDRLGKDQDALKQEMMGQASNARVAALIGRNFDQRASSHTIGALATAFKNNTASQLATITSANDDRIHQMATATPDQFDQAVNMIAASNQASEQGGLLQPGMGRLATSAALREAIQLRALTDPMGAKQLMQKYATVLDGRDLLATADHVQPLAERAQGDAIASGIINGAAASSTAGAPPGSLTNVVHQLESSGSMAAGQTGDGGLAFGPMQVHGPALADVNAKLGTNYTLTQLRDDPVLGRKVGETYLAMQYQKYGRADYALGAYNQGPGAMDAAIQSGKGVAGLPGGGPQYVTKGLALLGQSSQPSQPSQSDTTAASTPGAQPAPVPASGSSAAPAAADGTSPPPTTSSGTAAVPVLATGGAAPDVPAQLAQADQATKGMSLEMRQRVFSRIRQNAVEWQQSHAVELSALDRKLANLNQSYQQGLTKQEPPVEDIQRLLPKEANGIIDQLRLTRAGGDAVSAMRFASPADAEALIQQWSTPGSLAGSKVRMANGVLVGPGTLPQQDGSPGASELPEHMQMRTHILGMLQQAYQQQQTALNKDPAAYVAAEPGLASLAKAAQSGDPADQLAYNDASLAIQTRLGVPPSQQRILTETQVKSEAELLHSVDPAKGSMTAELDNMGKRYGDSFPQAFGELVRYGNIDPAYMVLGSMTEPSQVAARQDLQRVLQLAAQKGGIQMLQKTAPEDEVKAIKSGMGDTLSSFRSAYAYSPGGVALIGNVQGAVEHLATLYAMQGADAPTALDRAYQGIIGNRWDITQDGSLIAPKGKLQDVALSTAQVQSNLKAQDLAPIPDTTTGLRTVSEQQAMALSQAQRAQWRPNADLTGLELIANGRNGEKIPVRWAPDNRRDRSGPGPIVSIKFDKLPVQAPVNDPSAYDPTMTAR